MVATNQPEARSVANTTRDRGGHVFGIKRLIIRGDEQIAGVEKVLGAAAWTYVAAAVLAIGVWLFYLFVLFFRGSSAEDH
jgi:Zn-dependent membrane protease YugP